MVSSTVRAACPRAAAVCGIDAGAVRALARDYGTTQPAAIRLNYGMQRVRGGGNATRLIALLPCLVGAWRHQGEPVLEIAPDDAAPRGIASGQRVRVLNERGNLVCRAVVGARARPGVVNGLGVWWKKLACDGRNVNELMHQQLTDIGRAPSFYDCLVEVETDAAPAPA